MLGFFKHFLGYFLFIHKYYCKYGYSCSLIKKFNNINTNIKLLLFDSLLEGFLFLIVFIPLNQTFKNVFIVGISFHLIAEYLQIHQSFCKKYCQ